MNGYHSTCTTQPPLALAPRVQEKLDAAASVRLDVRYEPPPAACSAERGHVGPLHGSGTTGIWWTR